MFYAVARGRNPGVYTDWDSCKAQVVNVSNAKFRKFNSSKEAEEFVEKNTDKVTPKLRTVLPVKSLPLPLSPTKNSHSPKVQMCHLSQEQKVYSSTKNLSLPFPLTVNNSSAKKLNFGVPQKHQNVQQAKVVSSSRRHTQSDLNSVDGTWPIETPQVDETDVLRITQPTQSSGVESSPLPSVQYAGNLEERFEEFEKMYLEFHKQLISEIRATKRKVKGLEKLGFKDPSRKTVLLASVAEGMDSLETRFKTVMVDFSSELSTLQKKMTEDRISAMVSSLTRSSTRLTKTKKNGAVHSTKLRRNKLTPMMQPMTPSQVLLANKRSYSTDGKSVEEPPEKIVRTDESKKLVIAIKDEPADEADGGIHQFNTDYEGYVQVYTDGACEKNGYRGAKAGIGVWFGNNHPLNCSEPVQGRATNNVAEIQAAQWAVDLARRAGVYKLCINTDSEFVINSMTKWISRWKKRNWKLSTGGPVKNMENFMALEAALRGMDVKWNHVRGHAGILGNEMADSLARAGANRYKNG